MIECIVTLVLSAALGGGTEQFLITGKQLSRTADTITLDGSKHIARLVAAGHIAPNSNGQSLQVASDACMAVEYE